MAELSITVLGCSGTYSSSSSSCSSYLVRSSTTVVLVDAGPGSSIELQRHVSLHDVDGIIISHEHADHWSEMPSLYHAYRWGVERHHVPAWGTAGTKRLIDFVNPEATEFVFDWTTIDESSAVTVGDIGFTFSRTDHPVETLAMRAECDGAAIVYSSDTGPGWSPESFGQPANIVVHEASLTADLEDQGIPHVTGAQAAVNAAAVDADLLVLTHVPPGEDPEERRTHALRADFSGRIDIAAPGRTFSV